MGKSEMNSTVTKETPVGFELPAQSRQLTLELNAVPGGSKTIHNNYDAAAREGLSFPVAVAPTVAALIFKMMRECFGEGWIVGGKADLTFRLPIHAEDHVTAKAAVKGKITEGKSMRFLFDVWVETSKGEKAIVGSCSGVIPH